MSKIIIKFIDLEVLSRGVEFTAYVRAHGIGGNPIIIKKVLTFCGFHVKGGIDSVLGHDPDDESKRYSADLNDIEQIGGMDIERLATAHDLNMDGTPKKLGKKRGRKSNKEILDKNREREPNKEIVDVDEIRAIIDRRHWLNSLELRNTDSAIIDVLHWLNSLELKNIKFVQNGEQIEILDKDIEDWRISGMNNIDFVEMVILDKTVKTFGVEK